MEKVNLKSWATDAGVDLNELNQKLKLRDLIIKVRTKHSLTQAELASIVGVSRSRVAQIEAGVKLHRISFDILLRILQCLGCEYQIKAA